MLIVPFLPYSNKSINCPYLPSSKHNFETSSVREKWERTHIWQLLLKKTTSNIKIANQLLKFCWAPIPHSTCTLWPIKPCFRKVQCRFLMYSNFSVLKSLLFICYGYGFFFIYCIYNIFCFFTEAFFIHFFKLSKEKLEAFGFLAGCTSWK